MPYDGERDRFAFGCSVRTARGPVPVRAHIPEPPPLARPAGGAWPRVDGFPELLVALVLFAIALSAIAYGIVGFIHYLDFVVAQ